MPSEKGFSNEQNSLPFNQRDGVNDENLEISIIRAIVSLTTIIMGMN